MVRRGKAGYRSDGRRKKRVSLRTGGGWQRVPGSGGNARVRMRAGNEVTAFRAGIWPETEKRKGRKHVAGMDN